jgi:hypothetical protein
LSAEKLDDDAPPKNFSKKIPDNIQLAARPGITNESTKTEG